MKDECNDLLHELGHYLHGELPPDRAAALKAHLADCPPCFESADFQAQLKEIVARKCTEEVPAGLQDKILGFLHDESAS